MNKPHWVLQKTPVGQLFGFSIKRKGKVYHCAAVRKIDDLGIIRGKACFCIDSNKTVVEVTELPVLKKNILQLQIKNKIELLAIFDINEDISISCKTIQQQSQQQSLSIVAIPEELVIAGLHELTESYDIELINCVPMPAAVAGLLKQLGNDAFIVLLLTHEKAYVLGVHNGIALFIQGIPLSITGKVDPEATIHAINFGRQNLARNFDIETSRFLCMGENRGKVEYEELGEENWTPDWSHCLHGEGDDILCYPAIFWALLTDASYSYLPEEYKLTSRLRRLSTFLVFGAGISAIILSGLSYQNMQKVVPLRSQLQRERQQLTKNIAALRQRLPDSNNVTRVKAFLDIQKKVAVQPSISLVLQQIATVLPQNVTLLTMNITRKKGENTEQESGAQIPIPGQSSDMEILPPEHGSKAKAAILLDQQLIVHFNCSSKGDYGRVKARFDKAIKGFSSLFSLGAVNWGYEEKKQTGYLNCELLLDGEEK